MNTREKAKDHIRNRSVVARETAEYHGHNLGDVRFTDWIVDEVAKEIETREEAFPTREGQ